MTYDKHWWWCVFNHLGALVGALGEVTDAEITIVSNINRAAGGPCKETIAHWIMLFLEHGQIGPERKRTKKLFSRIQPVHLEFAKAILEIAPTAYYYEICEVLRIQFGVIYCKQQM